MNDISLLHKVAANYSNDFSVLYIDEFQISDIADAMIIEDLFYNLIQHNITILITSNRHPSDLYKGGIQREKFVKFIDFLKKNSLILSLNHDTDYRLNHNTAQLYYIPNNIENNKKIDHVFSQLSTQPQTNYLEIEQKSKEFAEAEPKLLKYKNRTITIPFYADRIGKFDFKDLCENYLYSADYHLICQHCDIIIIKNIPQLTPEDRNEAKRFVTLIDEIYQKHIILIISCATKIENIYQSGDGKFEFERTISRLKEIESLTYIKQAIKINPIVNKLLLLI